VNALTSRHRGRPGPKWDLKVDLADPKAAARAGVDVLKRGLRAISGALNELLAISAPVSPSFVTSTDWTCPVPIGAGQVTSLEHEPHFAAATRDRLQAEGLEGWGVVVDAPLRAHEATGVGWYDPAVLSALPVGIELLLVDGPPAGEPEIERSRYPALVELAPALAPGATVICDDALRPGEDWALERWRDDLGFAYELDRTAGIAVGHLTTRLDL
jgi:hypothetical protein